MSKKEGVVVNININRLKWNKNAVQWNYRTTLDRDSVYLKTLLTASLSTGLVDKQSLNVSKVAAAGSRKIAAIMIFPFLFAAERS